ncbi:unnamed protein product [Closterium sp. Naga37s-1]|nr:unnamed protein product [Closterium sp. Naga37s-1]
MAAQWLRHGDEGESGTAAQRSRGGRRAGAQAASEKLQLLPRTDMVHYMDVRGAWDWQECECCFDRAVGYRAQRTLGDGLDEFRSDLQRQLPDSIPLAPHGRPSSAIVEYSAGVSMGGPDPPEDWPPQQLFGVKCVLAPIRCADAMLLEWLAEPRVGVLMDLGRIRSRLPAILAATDITTAAPTPATAAASAAAGGTWASRWAAYRRAVSFAAFLVLVARFPRVVSLKKVSLTPGSPAYPAIMAQLGPGRQVENDFVASLLVQMLRVKESADLKEGFGFFVQHVLSGGLEKAHAARRGAEGRSAEKVHEAGEGGTGGEPTHNTEASRGEERCSSSEAVNGPIGGLGKRGKKGQWREHLKGPVWERYVDGMAWILEYGGGEGRELRCSHCSEGGSHSGGDVQVNGVPPEEASFPRGMTGGEGTAADASGTAADASGTAADTSGTAADTSGTTEASAMEDASACSAAARAETRAFTQANGTGSSYSSEEQRVAFLLLVAIMWPASILDMEQFDGKQELEGDAIRVKKTVGRKKGKARRGVGKGEAEEEEDDGEVWEELQSCSDAACAGDGAGGAGGAGGGGIADADSDGGVAETGCDGDGTGVVGAGAGDGVNAGKSIGEKGKKEEVLAYLKPWPGGVNLVACLREMLLGEPCYRPVPSIPSAATAPSTAASPANDVPPNTAASSTHPPAHTVATTSSTQVTANSRAATGNADAAALIADNDASGPVACRENRCGAEGCGRVEGGGVKLRSCSGCGKVAYWSRECQKAHWPSHKLTCPGRTSGKKSGNDGSRDGSSSGRASAKVGKQDGFARWMGKVGRQGGKARC